MKVLTKNVKKMKKKCRLFAFLIALFAVTAINLRTVLNTNQGYDLSMTSIEAISGEGGGNGDSSGGIDGENDEDIGGEVELPDVNIVCNAGGSGKCFIARAIYIEELGKCRLSCVGTGDPDDYCNGFLVGLLDFCSNFFDV